MNAIEEPGNLLHPTLIRRAKRLTKFGIVGASGVVVNLVIFESLYRIVLTFVGVDTRLLLANAAGIVVSIFTNFLLNDSWTWGDRIKGQRRHWFRRVAKYYVLASAAAVVQLLTTWLSFRIFWAPLGWTFSGIDISPTLALFTGIALGMGINFVASHLWAFRDVEDEH